MPGSLCAHARIWFVHRQRVTVKGEKMGKIFRRFCMYLAVGAGVCMALSPGMAKKALAASAMIGIEASESRICVGDSFYIVVTVESEAVIGDVDAYFTYDDKRLEFITGGSIASEENKLIHIKDKVSDADYVKKYSVELKAKRSGDVEIALISPFKILNAEDGTGMSASSNRLSLHIAKEGSAGTGTGALQPGDDNTVGETEEPGGSSVTMPGTEEEGGMPVAVNRKGARLESLSASPQLLSPEFQPRHYRYTTTVAADVTELELLYTTYEEDSYVEVIGNGDFVTGRNLVKIKVTGADGYTKTYKITVTRAAGEPEEKQPENGSMNQDSQEEEGVTVHSRVTKVYTDDEYRDTVTRLKLIIGILTAFSLFLLVIVLSLVLRLKGYKEDGLDDV